MSQAYQLMFDAADRVAQDGVLSNIKLITQLSRGKAPGSFLQNSIEAAIGGLSSGAAGKKGLAIYVLLPSFASSKPNVPGPYFDKATLALLILEDQVANNSAAGYANLTPSLRCDDVALRLAQLFQQWTDGGVAGNFQVQHMNPMTWGSLPSELVELLKGKDLVTWLVMLEGSLQTASLSKVAVPRISPDATPSLSVPQTVTVACTTSGAALWYTVDGTLPTPANGTLYAAPLTISTACLLRVVGYKTDFVPSNTAAAEYV